MKSVYKKLVTFEKAQEIARQSFEYVRETESVDISESRGRILSEDVYATRNNPPFSRATMDGFAVRHSDIAEASASTPIKLRISGESYIGEPVKSISEAKTCFRISTGAIVPYGADSVVRVEDTETLGEEVSISASVSPGENIAESGSDISESELLILRGAELSTNEIAVLAALGIPKVMVLKKLNVSVLSTGNELIHYYEPYSEGKISDANGVAILDEMSKYASINAQYSGIARDNVQSIRQALEKALEFSDVVILSGGSSAGESDLVYRIIDEMNPGILFHGVLVKPGLPTVLGRQGTKTVIGLPGFPVSALMIFRSIFLLPLLSASGSRQVPEKISGQLATRLKLELGKQNLVPVRVIKGEKIRVYPVTGLSGSISRFTSTWGFLSIPGDRKFLDEGSEVCVNSWQNTSGNGCIRIVGNILKSHGIPFTPESGCAEFVRMMPRDSIRAVLNRDADIAVFHALSDLGFQKDLVSDEQAGEIAAYAQAETEIGFVSNENISSIQTIAEKITAGAKCSGPSFRFLSNIVGNSEKLKKVLDAITHNFSGYIASGLEAVIDDKGMAITGLSITTNAIAGKLGAKFIPIANIRQVHLARRDRVAELEKYFDFKGLEKLR